MARKPCAQNVPQLDIDCSIICLPKGKYRRIARNAILPFYYDCSDPLADLNNKEKSCNKVFYIKNPKFYAGAEINNPGYLVTQNMRYAQLAKNNNRIPSGRKSTKIINAPTLANLMPIQNWYYGERETEQVNYYNNLFTNVKYNQINVLKN